ncbi:hypothetical protein VDGL01_07768 [Verticillium dahliae]
MGSLHSGFWVIIVPFSFPWLVARSLIPSLSPFPTPVNTRRLLFPGPRPSPLSLNRPALPPQLHHINPSPRRCTSHLQCADKPRHPRCPPYNQPRSSICPPPPPPLPIRTGGSGTGTGSRTDHLDNFALP